MFKLLYKEINKSSFQVIKEFAKKNKIKKIGHTGTLDPLAQGLLLVATDDDTKFIQFISNKDKEYKIECKLGFISKTYDAEGPINKFSDIKPSLTEVKNVLKFFEGNIQQTPPIFSAKKINGKKAYKLARNNKEIKLKPINVNIYKIFNVKYKYPYLEFFAFVSNGTYIRSLINDIGNKLKCGAYLTFLERTMVNGLRKNDLINVDKLLNMKTIDINFKQLTNLFQGKEENFIINEGNYIIKYNSNIIGILIKKKNSYKKIKLFGNKINKIILKKRGKNV